LAIFNIDACALPKSIRTQLRKPNYVIKKLLRSITPQNKSRLQSLGRKLGLEIRLNAPAARDDLRLAQMLIENEVELVIDIGANRGQFAIALFHAGFTGRIVSFEPVPAAHSALSENACAFGPRWSVAPAMALSDAEGMASFRLTSAETTSSLLELSEANSITDDGYVEKIEVPIRRLDNLIGDLGLDQQSWFLKIDVQGGEALVLAGAEKALSLAKGLVVELSTDELYNGQPLAFEMLAFFRERGFDLHDIIPGYRDPGTFRLLQFDAVLFHPDRIRKRKN
jgi:FkbM family methyltransferase